MVGLDAAAGGAVLITGACLPWVTTFAGLIAIPGIRRGNGRILAAAGVFIADSNAVEQAAPATRNERGYPAGGSSCGFVTAAGWETGRPGG